MSYDKQRLLRDADGVPIPQYWDVEEETFKPMGKPAFDGDIHLESSEEAPVYTKLTGSFIEHRGLSTDDKPSGENVGDTFFEIDTQDVYMWDGTEWELI